MNPASCKSPVLTIDQGNSSAKAVVWADGEPVDFLRLSTPDVEALLPLFERYDLEGCAFCSVARNDAKFLESVRRLVDGRLVVLTPSLPLPVKISYGTRDTLGADRIAAAIGAHSLFPGQALVAVDAGTAVTIDLISASGEFLGGNIAPGLRLRFKSLRDATSRLPLIDEEGELPLFGHDTATAIRCGVMRGMAAEINSLYAYAVEKCGAEHVVMAGADAAVLAPLLKEAGTPVMVDPYLVGRGLERIFMYNIKNI